MKRIIYIFLVVIGFIYAVGTVGAADQEIISFKRLVIQVLISIVCMAIGYFGLNLEEKREANVWHRKSNMRQK